MIGFVCFLGPPGFVWGKDGGMVWFRVCEAPLNDWANCGSVSADAFSRFVSMDLVLRGVGPILGNVYGV